MHLSSIAEPSPTASSQATTTGVYVIFNPANDQCLESILARNTAEERPQIRLDLRRDQILALFGREHTMNQIGDVGMGHFKRPSGTRSTL
jgi:hypothetical protein